MVIGLTGHTNGFGKYIYKYLNNKDYIVIGFSRSNGFDITSHKSREDIINSINKCDVFINNTYCKDGQVYLLGMINNTYPKMRIISVGSDITKTDGSKFKKIYRNKIELKNLCEKLGTEYKSWGYWHGHPISNAYPELITEITIEEAIQELICKP